MLGILEVTAAVGVLEFSHWDTVVEKLDIPEVGTLLPATTVPVLGPPRLKVDCWFYCSVSAQGASIERLIGSIAWPSMY